ncbi:MAG: response regulator [Anaerolineae bacterium]|nr:response regulator [Anaerolineae bacterium]
MAQNTPTLLIVEDDLDIAEMLNAYFRVQGYQVITVNWGEDGVRICESEHPDLVILDIRLPDIDGYEVAARLRANRKTQNIPIIFLTDKSSRADRIKGLELGSDDYIPKPFDIQELRLRVRNTINRVYQDVINNPVTSLPDSALLDERLTAVLHTSDWGLLLVSLDHLDDFRENYGFVASDDALRAVSVMLQNVIEDSGTSQDFLGHLAPTQLLLVTTSKAVHKLHSKIHALLDESLDFFYPLKDRQKPGGPPGNRLVVRYAELHAGQSRCTTISDLKSALLASLSTAPSH